MPPTSAASGGIGELRGIAQRARRGIGADAIGEATEQLPAGLTEDLAGEVPQSEVERPAPAVVKIDVGQETVVPFEGERVLADEKVLMAAKADHQIPGSDADRTFVGAHAHDRRIELRARLGVPAGAEGRIQIQAMLGDLDPSDLHAASPAIRTGSARFGRARGDPRRRPAACWTGASRHSRAAPSAAPDARARYRRDLRRRARS